MGNPAAHPHPHPIGDDQMFHRRSRLHERLATVRVRGLAGLVATVCVVALYGGLAGPAAAASPCGADWSFTKPAGSVWQRVTVPSLRFALHRYGGIVVRPVNAQKNTRLPAVLVVHGKGSGQQMQCSVWWAARLLAAHGYVAMTINHPTKPSSTPAQLISHHTDAVQSALAFLRSQSNPYADFTNRHDIGLVGYSLGGGPVSLVQQPDLFVKAIVGLDNIHAFGIGDSGAVAHCQLPPTLPVTPRVPALGEASETQCSTEGVQQPTASSPDFTDKRLGFKLWRMHGVASMQTVMQGFTHGTFGGLPIPSQPTVNMLHATQLRRAGYYMRAWFDLWLRADQSATARLLSSMPTGAPLSQVLSSKAPGPGDPSGAYQSSVFLPNVKDCDNLLVCP
jgi:hypothetical protein